MIELSARSTPNSARVLVALATFNEIENLPSLVDQIHRMLPDADVLVVDDSSPDGTGRWCDERAHSDPRLKCLHRAGKEGLGSATLAAMGQALDASYDVFVTMDADWSHDPQYLRELLAATQSADVALGSRYCPGGKIEGWSLHRRILSRCVNRLGRLFLRLPLHDLSGAFRAYRVAALRAIDPTDIRSSGYSYLEEILWQLHRAGCTFAEVPITFYERRAGKSKINLGEAVAKLHLFLRLAMTR